jgi:3-isopropylmalate/(R)-2-methylmalate dehydratase large subunit
MTLTEKILARASGRAHVRPGDNIWVNADILLTHDVCGPGTIGVFHREFGRDAKVWDARKIVIIPDHYIFTADSLSNRNVDTLRTFVREQGLPYFYDVIDEADGAWQFDPSKGQLKRQFGNSFAGVCHTALPEKGHARPGEVLFGTDSHSGNSPPASATRTPGSSSARASCSSRSRRRCASTWRARSSPASWPRT